ncbi:hypothetical protein [Pseudomonas sp. WHRI 8519]|uniref:hypothetical protein n=1 Tax=Pseudomonas sp. WHRI 8519 TaxID=3162567 RepID=UPI0032EE3DFD
MIDATNIKKVSWGLLGVFVFFLALGPSKLKFFWPAFFMISLAALGWTLHLIYTCEKFTTYILSLVLTTTGIFSLLSCNLAYHAATRFWIGADGAAFQIALAPMAITALTYLVLVNGKPSFHPFEHDGIKVQPRPQRKQKPSTVYSPLFVAGVTTLAASAFTKEIGILTSELVASFGLLACSMTLLFYARHIIRGVRSLRNQEKTMPKPYTFMHIEGIRKARSHWWMSRLFKWIASWRASPGA